MGEGDCGVHIYTQFIDALRWAVLRATSGQLCWAILTT